MKLRIETTLTPEQETVVQARFAMWRFHLWGLNYGSYNEIERQVKEKKLTPFVCPKVDCDCSWKAHY